MFRFSRPVETPETCRVYEPAYLYVNVLWVSLLVSSLYIPWCALVLGGCIPEDVLEYGVTNRADNMFDGCDMYWLDERYGDSAARCFQSLSITVAVIWMSQSFNVRFYMTHPFEGAPWQTDQEAELQELKRRPLDDTIMRCVSHICSGSIEYMGKVGALLPKPRLVLEPVDMFMTRLLKSVGNDAVHIASRTYKRVNGTLEMMLQALCKYGSYRDAEPQAKDRCAKHRVALADKMLSDAKATGVDSAIRAALITKDFESLEVDGNTAAGHGYPSGTKKKDVLGDATRVAESLLDDEAAFHDYMRGHEWRTTSRAKLIDRDAPNSARLVSYPGLAYNLVMGLYTQTLAPVLYQSKWCSVGMSWFHGGAAKFAKRFRCQSGKAPAGMRYVSIDIKSWDSTFAPWLLDEVKALHVQLLKGMNVTDGYIERFISMYDDMINAKMTFAGGHVFQVFQGMQSGFPFTTPDNCIGHQIVSMAINETLGLSNDDHEVYGDDNFRLVPDHVSDQQLVDAYLEYGFTVGAIHSSVELGEVDYLSKHVKCNDGIYYVHRETVETVSRLIMPDEAAPMAGKQDRSFVAAERLVGHLIDNPFNPEVSGMLTSALTHLRDFYDVPDEIDVSAAMRQRAPFRDFPKGDDSRFRRVPLIPSMEWLSELHGVPLRLSDMIYPATPIFRFGLDFNSRDTDLGPFFAAHEAYEGANERMRQRLSYGRRKRLRALMSPYGTPTRALGFHAARLDFAMKHFDIGNAMQIVDFGSHPGACASLMAGLPQMRGPDASRVPWDERNARILCVTLNVADDNVLCPYLLRQECVRVLEQDANTWKPDVGELWDLLHDDVDVVSGFGTQEAQVISSQMLARFRRCAFGVRTCVGMVRYFDESMLEDIYQTYSVYGYFDIVKPHYSNPWRPEFAVCFRRKIGNRIPKKAFKGALRAYLNSQATGISEWAHRIERISLDASGGDDIPVNPLQNDPGFKSEVDGTLYTTRFGSEPIAHEMTLEDMMSSEFVLG